MSYSRVSERVDIPTPKATTSSQPGSVRDYEAAPTEESALLPNPVQKGVQFINTAIRDIGYGDYQKHLFFLCGMGWLADNMWLQVLAVSLPAMKIEFGLEGPWAGIATTATMAGMFLGSFFWGGMADYYGRKVSFFYTLLLSAVFGTLGGFMMDIYAVCACFFVMGLGAGGSLPTDASLFLEFVPKSRANMLVLMSMFWPAGQVLASGFGWIFMAGRDTIPEPGLRWGWRSVVFTTGITTFVMFFLRFFVFKMIESPKYLFKTGDRKETYQSLKALAKYNDESLDFTIDEMPRIAVNTLDQQDSKPKQGFFERLKPLFTKQLRYTTIIIWLVWMLTMLGFNVFYSFLPAFLEQQPSIFGPKLDYVVISLFGIPGSIIATYAVDTRLGRKGTMMYSTLLTAVGLFSFVYFKDPRVLLFCNCMASLCSNIMWAVIYSFTPEVFPTSARGTGTGIASGIGKSMGIIAPLLSGSLLQIDVSVPVFTACGLFVLDAFCMFLIPIETRDQPVM